MADFAAMEKKWQQRWAEAKLFEANPGRKRKIFVTFPYPYVNAAPHVGHSYTSMRADIYARFKRMQGYNVLFPQGFHATGEPIVGAVERLKKNDPVQIRTFKLSGATDADMEEFKKGPQHVALFWMKRWMEDMKLAGFSIDWRRTFITTAITPAYSRFIEWQYNTLRRKGYITQGTHPVVWCPHCKSPTGDHDRLEGEGEGPLDYTVVKFGFDDAYLVAATLRPETLYGVTNIWVNPDATYVKANVDGEKWVMGRAAAAKLSDQLKKVRITGEVAGSDLAGKRCVDPLSNRRIPILPAGFVDADNATGIVMSVPAHAPYDWIAVKDIMDKHEEYGVAPEELEPVSIISTPGFGEIPAAEACKRMGITSQKQEKELDEATSDVYKKEFHLGTLKETCGPYAGMKVSEVKELLARDLAEKKIADVLWECSAEVVCRCTTRCHVKILENQWFLRFSDPAWKERVRKHLRDMRILPEEAARNFENTISWLKDKACSRKTGLGTPLPWDREWIVETLGDSTIYMAYYTIAGVINEHKIGAEFLTDEVFDYIFLGKGNAAEVSRHNKLKTELLESMKREFDYFYPVDMRNSGKDLIQNHLTFYLFHHAAIWDDPDRWPRAISVNGYVMVEGEKMSKSKGNMIALRDLLQQYGADMTRINMAAAAEGLNDANWSAESVRGYRSRYDMLFDAAANIKNAKRSGVGNPERFLASRLASHVKRATESYESMKVRSAVSSALFDALADMKWYIERNGGVKECNGDALRRYVEHIVRMLSPVTPHICEEIWSALGNNGFVSVAEWPESAGKDIDENAEAGERLVKDVMEDAAEIGKLVGKPAKTAHVFVAPQWKHDVYSAVLEDRTQGVIKNIAGMDKAAVPYAKKLLKKDSLARLALGAKEELAALKDAEKFLERNLGMKVVVLGAGKSDNPKAAQAEPGRPGIYLE